MEDLIDLIASDASPAQISDNIKNMLHAKAAEKIDAVRPLISSSIFDESEASEEEYTEDQE